MTEDSMMQFRTFAEGDMKMTSRQMVVSVMLALTVIVANGVNAYPIVTMPTASLVPTGTTWLNYYAVDLNPTSSFAPDSMSIGATYIGLSSRLELDLTYIKPESVKGSTTIGIEYLVRHESSRLPAIAIGAEDLTQNKGDTSVYVALAKTLTPAKSLPSVRLNMGYGTSPRSAMFGGAQIRLTKDVSVAALSDGHDSIYCISYFVQNTPLVIKAGTLGNARWAGVQYSLKL